MLIDFKQLKALPVETESGILLGHITDFTLEVTTLVVKQIKVNPSKLLVFSDDLLINSDQITSITSEKVIVSDNVKKIPTTETASQNLSTEPAASINAEAQN